MKRLDWWDLDCSTDGYGNAGEIHVTQRNIEKIVKKLNEIIDHINEDNDGQEKTHTA